MLDYEQLEQRIEAARRDAIVPGLALAIVQSGEVVYANGFGVTSTEDGALPVTPDTLFRIGSVTKPLTATMIMRLVWQGVLELDVPVTTYVPWLQMGQPDNVAGQVTLRQLLSHTSGLPTTLSYVRAPEVRTLEDYARVIIPDLPLVAPPGTVFSYSNPGSNLAGYIAEVAAGKPYTQLMQELLFDPLHMRRTTFDPTVAMTYPLSQSFVLDSNNQPVVKRPFIDNPAEYPCGFAISTANDLANFTIMHMREGLFNGRKILRPEVTWEMYPQADALYSVDERGYGLGLRTRNYKGIGLTGHNGAIAKYGAVWSFASYAEIGIIMLFNRNPQFWGAADKLVTWIVEESLDEMPNDSGEINAGEADVTRWAGFSGRYTGSGAGIAEIDRRNGRLALTWNGDTISLEPFEDNLYFGRREGSSAVISVKFVGGNPTDYLLIDGMLCHRADDMPGGETDLSIWAAYAGRYVGEIDEYNVRIENGQVYLYSEDERTEAVCTLLDDHRLACSLGLFEFIRSEDGTVIELRNGLWRFPRFD